MLRSRSARLSAAVAVGAGLLVTGAAPAALAAPAQETATAVPAEGPLQFRTYHEVQADDLRVTIAPAEAVTAGGDGSGDTRWTFYRAAGEQTPVEFSYDAELERGVVDVAQARRALGEAGPVIVSVYVDGGLDGADDAAFPNTSVTYGPDADLTDADPGEVVDRTGPQEYDFTLMPEVDRTTLLAAPGSRTVWTDGTLGTTQSWSATMAVADGPDHGTLVSVPARVEDGAAQRHAGTVYVADEGFTGTDTVTYTFTRDGETRTRVVTYSIGDERADDVPLTPEFGGLPSDLTEADVLALLPAGEDEGAEPATPTAQPTAPVAEPTAPTAEPTAPAGEPSAPAGEHTVPEKVQTGGSAHWLLAGAGVLGVGALVALRPRRRSA